jgi:RNA polymerase sigma-70 factor (ECF subfamily)
MNDTGPYREHGSETALVRRAQAGDREAFDRLAQHYRAVLRALAFLRTGDMQEAEDLAQDVLTRAWQKLPTLQDPALFLPWIKAIAANACNSWYRRSRPWPDSLSINDRHPADPGLSPPAALLAREKQRELRQALAALPEANRLALMMHVWGGYSYEDIARVAGVQVSTVEGRIYRAKRQLRRLLLDEGVEFTGEPHRQWQAQNARPYVTRQRRKVMTKKAAINPPPQALEQPLTLVLFTDRFSALVDCGVSLVRTLHALEEIPPPYGEAAREIRLEVEQGQTLSRSMSRWPELFPKPYIGLVRAGEVGGILEETLRRAADLMAKEWQLARQRPGSEEPMFFTLAGEKRTPRDWAQLSEYQQTMTLLLFCETLSILLVSGVPILQTLETVAELLPPTPKAGILEAREAIKRGEPILPSLERMGILPRFVLRMIEVGEDAGCVDRTLHRAAEVFEHELACRMPLA